MQNETLVTRIKQKNSAAAVSVCFTCHLGLAEANRTKSLTEKGHCAQWTTVGKGDFYGEAELIYDTP